MSLHPVLEEYGRFLDRIAMSPHRLDSGLAVPFHSLTNIDYLYIDVKYEKGKVTISNYFGLCYTTRPDADRLCSALQERYPFYRIWVEKYSVLEIEVEETFPLTSIEELHRRVVRMAKAVNDGVAIGKDLLGENFSR